MFNINDLFLVVASQPICFLANKHFSFFTSMNDSLTHDGHYPCETESRAAEVACWCCCYHVDRSRVVLFQKGTKLTYRIRDADFGDKVEYIAKLLEEAIHHLTRYATELRFERIHNKENEADGKSAHITVIFEPGNVNHFATSFFPPGDGDLRIAQSFAKLTREEQVCVLLHELGHIIGLRHEEKEEDAANVESDTVPSMIHHFSSSKSFMKKFDTRGFTESDQVVLGHLYGAAASDEQQHDNEAAIEAACARNNKKLVRSCCESSPATFSFD